MATMKTLNGYGFNATELNGKKSDSYLQLGDDGTGSTGAAPTINAGTFGGMTVNQFVDMIYPVGSIYMSVSNTSPETLFGGTWVQLTDRFLIGAGNRYSVNGTGGASSVNITPSGNNSGTALNINQMPPHSHDFALNIQHSDGTTTTAESLNTGIQGGGRVRYNGTTRSIGGGQTHTHTFVGETQTVSTMPPYLAVYMWKRTA